MIPEGALMAAFFDHYWWAVFLFIIFIGAFVLRPATPRRRMSISRESEDADAPDR